MSFLNPEFYSKYGTNLHSSIMYEDNRPVGKGNALLQSITEFVCTTEFCTTTGMSLLDILEMDYGSYLSVKKTFESVEKPKQAHLNNTLNQLQQNLNRK